MMIGPGRQQHSSRGACTLSSLVSVGLLGVIFIETLIASNYRSKYLSLLGSGSGARGPGAGGPGGAGTPSPPPPQQEPQQSQPAGTSRALAAGAATGTPSSITPTASSLPLTPRGLVSLMSNETFRQRNAALLLGQDGRPLRSSKWAPLRISVCTEGMLQHWAPCIRLPGLHVAYAEEVGPWVGDQH